MKRFIVSFDITLAGVMEIEAESEDAAEEAFNALSTAEVLKNASTEEPLISIDYIERGA